MLRRLLAKLAMIVGPRDVPAEVLREMAAAVGPEPEADPETLTPAERVAARRRLIRHLTHGGD